MNLYKLLYELYYYLTKNVSKTYLLYGVIILVILIVMNISSILWWSLLGACIYYLYTMKKTQVSSNDTELEKICKEKPELLECKAYQESIENHKKIINAIKERIMI
jgi:hypothetical protein